MTNERVRERDVSPGLDDNDEHAQNIVRIEDSEQARKKIMGRFNADQSIIQPPESSERSLGDAIRLQLSKYK